ncbi:MAG: tRNA (adenosine(37)-N6)-threonylcarbamoyltransferase complex ATPase subunit type 1 TsaE [Chloroflexi bacterium]|nr:tRNA (adenosine(37)-N6)-threonylcarbamoyltransferase complex ATPase subunit type 1 TsaE [Chloroflexota bacterium]
MTVLSRSAAETRRLGARLGAAARAGDTFLLDGGFGVGKTVLVQGMAEGLGVETNITSPSFVMMTEHRGRLMLHHMDLYRLERRDPDLESAIEELMDAGGVLAIEWPGLLPPDLAADTHLIRLGWVDENVRQIEVSSDDPRVIEAARVEATEARAD